MNIFVAGGRGLVGSAIVRQLRGDGHTVDAPTRDELDLRDPVAVMDYFVLHRPEAVVLAAAKVGGIVANNTHPVDFLMANLEIQTSVFRAAHYHDVRRLVFLGSSCIYPKYAPQPMRPVHLLKGQLEPTNQPYALAKLAGLEMCSVYRREHLRDYFAVLPSNVYGPGDNYREGESHVVPALIRKFVEAVARGHNYVALLGNPGTQREFLHSTDLARAVCSLLFHYDGADPVNVPGDETTIGHLAHLLAVETGFVGSVRFTGGMIGTPRKALVRGPELDHVAWTRRVRLEAGIRECVKEFTSSTNLRK